jgi:hypothetical protein
VRKSKAAVELFVATCVAPFVVLDYQLALWHAYVTPHKIPKRIVQSVTLVKAVEALLLACADGQVLLSAWSTC